VASESGCTVEVFCFGPAQRRLTEGCTTEAISTFNRQIDELTARNVAVGVSLNAARADGTADALSRRGMKLHVARDEFVRFTLEQATVITL
jgi:hypothetical protein